MKWKWREFVRTVAGGLLAGAVGGAVYELLLPGPGVIKATAVAAAVGAITAAIVYVVDKF